MIYVNYFPNIVDKESGKTIKQTNNKTKTKQRATELEWLKFFYVNADFGPADSDVHICMEENFKEQTGKDLPEGYSWLEDE